MLWFSLPWSAGRLFDEALAETSLAFARTAGIGAWGGWTLGLAALLAPTALSLTIVRFLAPAGLAASCWAVAAVAATAADGGVAGGGAEGGAAAVAAEGGVAGVAGGVSGAAIAGTICTGSVCVLAALPLLGSRFVDAMSYGDERRLPLRPPAAVLLLLLPLTWALTLGGLTAGPLLWASGHGLAGPLLLGFGLPAAALGARSMHSLSRRWLVFVPGGVVLHDHFTISAPTLIRRNQITSLRPAPAVRNKDDPPVRDLSAGAGGLVLELRLSSSAQIPLRGSRAAEALEAMLLVPTRPKLALEVAAERKIPFG